MTYDPAQQMREAYAYSARVYGLLPRPISWKEVQPDDTIRAEKPTGILRVAIGKVGVVDEAHFRLRDSEEVRWIYSRDGWSLTLIDRPKPVRPAGSLWYHPTLDAGFVRTDGIDATVHHYVGFTIGYRGFTIYGSETVRIAELTPWTLDVFGDLS